MWKEKNFSDLYVSTSRENRLHNFVVNLSKFWNIQPIIDLSDTTACLFAAKQL